MGDQGLNMLASSTTRRAHSSLAKGVSSRLASRADSETVSGSAGTVRLVRRVSPMRRRIVESGRNVALSVCLLLVVPVGVGAQGIATLAELAPFVSLGDARGEDAPVSDAGVSPPRAGAGRSGFTVEEVIGPIPLT